jgi:hypothetical protein
LLGEAETTLLNSGLRSPEAKALVQPAEDLLRLKFFWRGQKDGLAIFLAPDFFRAYPVPLEVPELVTVSGRFHLKPLLSLLGTVNFTSWLSAKMRSGSFRPPNIVSVKWIWKEYPRTWPRPSSMMTRKGS